MFFFWQVEPEERPKISADAAEEEEESVFPQAWSDGGESCPGGTVPIRRTTESDLRRYSGSLRRYGMKPRAAGVRRDSTSDGHEVRAPAETNTYGDLINRHHQY